jgi:formiminotetrahydrofolate cyclodeaminase
MKTNQLLTLALLAIILLNSIIVLQNAGIIRPVRESTVSVSKISQEVATKISNSEIDVNLSSVAGHDLCSTLTGHISALAAQAERLFQLIGVQFRLPANFHLAVTY